ncbi:MAG: YihY/virulence factor BrkB family protein [Actinomycetota bacterium]|nr:YihY/virulence factor BrkB family protein [Actinomycetota bacterium]
MLRRTIRGFKAHDLTDWAAALTYYAVLSVFPALIVLVALLGVFGHANTTSTLLRIVAQVGPRSAVQTFRGPIDSVIKNKGGAGALLGVGLVGALWSASGYIGAFMRAANKVYDVGQRRFLRKAPLQVGITILMVLLLAVVMLAIILTGPLATAVGKALGVRSVVVTVWSIAKWPVLLIIVVSMISILYYLAPNVRQPGFHWVTPGGLLAMVVWILASVAFAFYVANFGAYNKTYGSLGAVIIFLLWIYISNNALLLGLEFNAQRERERELQAGLPAEEKLQLPPRDPSKT